LRFLTHLLFFLTNPFLHFTDFAFAFDPRVGDENTAFPSPLNSALGGAPKIPG
jgi:hypothetical protein